MRTVLRALATVVLSTFLGTAPAVAQRVVVVEPPADESSPAEDVVLRESDDATPVGFIAGYLGLTAVAVTLAVVSRRQRSIAPGASGSGLGIAYGPRSGSDFWAERDDVGGGRRPVRA